MRRRERREEENKKRERGINKGTRGMAQGVRKD